MSTQNHPVVFFDGECNLCNSFVQFIIRHDKKGLFLFASLQSAAGQNVLKQFNGKAPDSVILSYNNTYFIKSAAALRVLKLLGGALGVLYAGVVLPHFIRDGVYDLIARNRYKWFGKRAECMMPTPELTSRFLA